METINLYVDVPGTPEQAFRCFTDGMAGWWPREYTWSGERALAAIGIEHGAGGLCYEIGPHGFRCDWGRVLVWDPPRRLVFTWQIGPAREPVPDPARAGEVELLFRETVDGETLVELEHRGFEKYGPEAAEYRAGLESSAGWPYLLGLFAKAVMSG